MHEIREWIPMDDGVRLAASVFLPDEVDGGSGGPRPVLLEALPYRKDDLTASYRSEYARLCGEGGYAVARVDLRGTGSSEGLAEDEYAPREQQDLAKVIAWLADRPWSSGAVGMYGTSYSGFNSLQMAVEQPPALRAVCAIYASDDRYTDDVHYTGGALRGLDLVDYVLYMVAMNALPPVPAVFGDGWRDEWRRRVEGAEPWLLRWLEEQHDGPYWRHGSLRLGSRPGTMAGYERIECPTMIVAGWADGYRNNSLRTYEALRCPKRLLIGPWSHMSPATSLPGPRVDLVPELIRWFDRHLRGTDNGVDREPPIRVFVRRPTRPAPDLDEHRGEWRSEPVWPPARLNEIALQTGSDGPDVLDVRGDVGTAAWISCAGRLPWGQSLDQRADEVHSLTYTWAAEPAEVEILGHPRLSLRIMSSAPVAFLSAKLCDVFPDGTSVLVTRGFLDLAHRDSSVDPQPLEPGEDYGIDLELDATSWVFEARHRVRLSLAGADWPNIWPPPSAATLAVDRSSLRLMIPVLVGEPPIPEPPELAPAPPGDTHAPELDGEQPPTVWRVEHDVLGRVTRAVVAHGSNYDAEHGARVEERYAGSVGVSCVDPGDARADAAARFTIAWPEGAVGVEARLRFVSDAKTYHVEVDLDTVDGGEPFLSRRWSADIPRKLQ